MAANEVELPDDDPKMIAWNKYKKFELVHKFISLNSIEANLWEAFLASWNANNSYNFMKETKQ